MYASATCDRPTITWRCRRSYSRMGRRPQRRHTGRWAFGKKTLRHQRIAQVAVGGAAFERDGLGGVSSTALARCGRLRCAPRRLLPTAAIHRRSEVAAQPVLRREIEKEQRAPTATSPPGGPRRGRGTRP